MNERGFRVFIKHYFMKGESPLETKDHLYKVDGQSIPSIRTVSKRSILLYELSRLRTIAVIVTKLSIFRDLTKSIIQNGIIY